MQTNTDTTYNIYLQDNVNGQFAMFTLTASGGATDAAILSLAQTLKNFAWPAAMGPVLIQVNRNDETTTAYNGNISVTPPVFE
jgi:L-rhamnose mutarotase